MHLSGQKEFTVWEWVILFGLMAAAFAMAEVFGLSRKWEDGVVYTVVLFAVVVLALRPAWGRPAFWQNLVVLFALHVVGMIVVVSVLPVGRYGIPKLVWSIALMAEALLIGGVLWKRTARSKP
jgi:hypothetical protein